MSPLIKIGLSLMPEADYYAAAKPLFDEAAVDILEWSFDMCWGRDVPQHCQELLTRYSKNNCLYGHGVSFSLLTATRTNRQRAWLQYLQEEVRLFQYQKISEHFGFLTTNHFWQGAPLSMPCIEPFITIAADNLRCIHNIAQVPIGIENLGFAFSKQDAIEQGQFIAEILNRIDGFLLLDLHNIYCHMVNFNFSFDEIMASLPLERAREIHISGGSFRSITSQTQAIYCDSHDQRIPDTVFKLLEQTLQQTPQIENVIFERMGNTLSTEEEKLQFRKDFYTIKSIIN